MIKLQNHRLILASQSPRRRELLGNLGLDFEVRLKSIEEDFPNELALNEVPSYLARKKAHAHMVDLASDEIVLTSDTVVILNEKILGKPGNSEEARSMLLDLSGNEHRVITAICLASLEKQVTIADTAQVFFRKLTLQEIDFYIENYRPFDKAGAYGIQEWIGFVGVEKIEGSFFTIMGLPLHLVYQILKDWDR